MKERPILFSGSMVRAILDGRKTQTRRIMKLQPSSVDYYLHGNVRDRLHGLPVMRDEKEHGWAMCGPFKCPFIAEGMYAGECGRLGNSRTDDNTTRKSLLWVREEHYRFGHWEPIPNVSTKTGRQKWKFISDDQEVLFHVPGCFRKAMYKTDPSSPAWHKRLARFMPRKISRITLEITAIRVERLNEISEEDAAAEGVESPRTMDLMASNTPWASKYRTLWESINGPGSWGVNPWVWVIEFVRCGQS